MTRKFLFLSLIFIPYVGFSQTTISNLTDSYKSDLHLDSIFHDFYTQHPNINWIDFVDETSNYFDDGSERVLFLFRVVRFLNGKEPQATLPIHDKCIEIAKAENKPDLLAEIYGQKSFILAYSGKYEESVENLSYALSLINKKDHTETYAGLLADLGQTYQAMGDYENSEKYFLNSSELYLSTDDKFNPFVNDFNLGSLYMEMGRNDEAIALFEKCIAKAPDLLPMVEAYAYGNIGNALVNKGEFRAAIKSQLKGLRMEQKFEDELSMMDSHAVLGMAYANLKMKDSSYFHFEKSINLAIKHQLTDKLLGFYEAQADALVVLEDFKAAYKAGENIRELNDSIRTLEVQQTQLELKEKYETEEKENRNKELAAEVSRQNQLIIGAIILLVAVIFVAWYIYRINRKVRSQSLQLQEATESKERFFSNITHEFRTPLTLILSPLEKVIGNPEISQQKLNQLIRSNHRHASQLLTLVNQLLELNKLESGHMAVKNTVGDFNDFIDQYLERFRHAAENKNLQFKIINKDVSGFYSFDRSKWERILTNLIGNALKFTEAGHIEVRFWQKDEGIALTVTDSGIGIPAENINKIFDRFYQVDDSSSRAYEGTGIGLALVKELVELMNGKIEVNSNDKGTTFSLEIPMEKVLNQQVEESLAETIFSQDKPLDESKALMLIVEDNHELRAFLKEQLEEKWNVLEASNGEDGWEIIKKELPDIVVSDVMMPGMNGYELCEKTKSEGSTSHINFLMLTAKASQEAVVQGLEKGADDYITKPFHPHELELRIYNILQQQERLRQHLMQELLPTNLEEVQSELPHIEDEFLKNMYEYVDNNINDNSLTADRLASEMAMSKSTLNRKLRALLDTTSVDFIRDIRLKKSVEFIKAGHSISETAYSVGFESPSYFTKMFKARYNKTPSEFASELTI